MSIITSNDTRHVSTSKNRLDKKNSKFIHTGKNKKCIAVTLVQRSIKDLCNYLILS